MAIRDGNAGDNMNLGGEQKFGEFNASKLYTRLVITYGALVILVACVVLLSEYYHYQAEWKQVAELDGRNVSRLIQHTIEHESHDLMAHLEFIAGQKTIMAAFKAENKEQLYREVRPIYQLLQRHAPISRLDFHHADTRLLLGATNTSEPASDIFSIVKLAAQQDMARYSGIGIDALGQPEIVSVIELTDGDQSIGYLSAAMGVSHFFEKIELDLGLSIFVIFKNENITDLNSEKGSNFGKRLGFSSASFMASETIDANIKSVYRRLANGDDGLTAFQMNDKRFTGTLFPFKDLSGQALGNVLVIDDLTEFFQQSIRLRVVTLISILAFTLLGCYLFFMQSKSVQSKVLAYLGNLTQEIRDRKKELERKDKAFNKAKEIAKIGEWELNMQTNALYWSDEVFSIFEIDPSQFAASFEGFIETIHPDDREMVTNAYQEAVESKQAYSIVHRLMMSDGRIKWVQESCDTEYSESGEPMVSRGTVIDITDLKNVEIAFANSRKRYLSMVENIIEGVVVIDSLGSIVEFNKSAEKTFGYSKHDLMGKNVRELVPEPHKSKHSQYIKNYLTTGERKIIGKGRELMGRKSDGTEFPLWLGIGEMEIEGEKFFIGTITDLSEKAKLENQLRRTQKMEAIGQLTGGIAHDFNNILGIVVGQLDLMARKVKDNPDLSGRVDKAMNAALRGSKLTKRLLEFSKPSMEFSEPKNINSIIESVHDLITKSLTSRISLKLNLAEELWLSEVDTNALEDVLINLVNNARDAIENTGSITISTFNFSVGSQGNKRIPTIEPGKYVCIELTDDGIGMSEEVVSKVFDPFFTTKKEGRGTGLGLSMVYSTVQRFKGHINVVSHLGRGTCFQIYFPKSVQETSKLDTEPRQPQVIYRSKKNETILIVDDETDLLDAGKFMLEELGYNAIAVNDSTQALDILKGEKSIACLVSDVVMPAMDGFQLVEAAKKIRPTIKVLLTSGFTQSKSVSLDAYKSTGGLVLMKPYRESELSRYLSQTLYATEESSRHE